MAIKIIPAGEFKNHCLALLDDVARTGSELVVTKRGRPVARVVPTTQPKPIAGSVIHCGDILAPAFAPDSWHMDEP
jgi:prevent-host-death family protein